MRQVEGCEKVEGRGRWESDCPLHSRSMTTTTICSKTSKQQLFLGTGEVVRRSAAKVSLRYLASPSLQDPEVDMTMMIFNEGVLQGKQGGGELPISRDLRVGDFGEYHTGTRWCSSVKASIQSRVEKS